MSSAPAAPGGAVPDVNALTGRWDDLVEGVRAGGKPMLASALSHASVASVNRDGVVTIELDEANDIFAHSITTAKTDLLAALRRWFPGVSRIELRKDENASAAPPKRLTDEMIRADRVASLRKKDPVLNAAIEALDLDVAD
jgi:DNA polymerase-3 subunit gamma/tau